MKSLIPAIAVFLISSACSVDTEDEITGTDSVDATGHVVTAGFIDTHTHSSDNTA